MFTRPDGVIDGAGKQQYWRPSWRSLLPSLGSWGLGQVCWPLGPWPPSTPGKSLWWRGRVGTGPLPLTTYASLSLPSPSWYALQSFVAALPACHTLFTCDVVMMLLEGKLVHLEFVAGAHGLAAQSDTCAWCSTIGASLQLRMHSIEHLGLSLDGWKTWLDQ